MRGWTLVAVGALPPGLLEKAATFLAQATSLPVSIHPDTLDLQGAYEPRRAQFDCRRLLPPLETVAGESDSLVLGLADVDLYSAIFTFVFGEARLHGPAGIVSIHRLRPTLYGLPDDPDLLESRMRREVLHEAGHLLGLVHCADPDCAMHFSAVAEEIDLKRDEFCTDCRDTLAGNGH
ncbi:MAG: archaemetzincin family Zn-dependent metalloprotease [Candidatus Eisenbacteria bacterium]